MGNKSSSAASTTTATAKKIMENTKPQRVAFALKSMKVMTYNVWFDNFHFDLRMEYIIDKTLELLPDVCCYQEVLPRFANMLQSHEDITKFYVISPFHSTSYGTLTLVRREFCPRFRTVEFPTMMGRYLLKTVCNVNGSDIAIGNVHLESLSSEKVRRKQLVICEKSLRKYPCSILLGDFNFCSERNFHNIPNVPLENDFLCQVMPAYIDLWPQIHPKSDNTSTERELGYTFDSKINKMIPMEERMRYDRIIARYAGSGVVPCDIELLGVDAIQQDRVWPSDHFGLIGTFQLHQGGVNLDYNSNEASMTMTNVEDAPPIPLPFETRVPVTLNDIQDKRNSLSSESETIVTKRDGSRYKEHIDKTTGEVTLKYMSTESVACSLCGTNMGFQFEETPICPTCLRNEDKKHFAGFSAWSLSKETSSRITYAIQSAVLRDTHPLRLLAIDFDATICQIHTYGHWRGSADTLTAHIRPVFRAILEASVHKDAAPLRVGVVTFSGQKDLIRDVLVRLVGESAASRIFLRTAKRDWSVSQSFSKNSLLTGKQPHILSILEEISNETGEKISAEQVMLIDDDIKNIACAKQNHHKTVAFPPLPLPGIHMKSVAMDASGVQVIHRCQLSHGALLCISRGSVVDFSAPGQGAIVNAANCRGLGGGGVDGAISKAGGPRLLAARKAWPQDAKGDRIPTGECRFTGRDSFGDLKVSHVLHTAGPDYNVIEGLNQCNDIEESLKIGDGLLTQSYTNTMRLAKENRIELLGFSLISAGVYRGSRSLRSVLTIAIETIAKESFENLREVHLVAYSKEEADMLLKIITEYPPTSLQRGCGGDDVIRKFIDDFEGCLLDKTR